MSRRDESDKPTWILAGASIAVVVGALYLAKGVLVPLTLAALLSFLLSPVCDWLERRRLGRIPAVLLTAFLGFAVLGILSWTAVVQMSSLAPKFPEYRQNIEAKLESVNAYAVAAIRKVTRTSRGVGQVLPTPGQSDPEQGTSDRPYAVRVVDSPASPLEVFGGMFGTLLQVLGTAGIVIVLVIFFLVRREDIRDRFIHLVGKGHVTVTTQMLEDAAVRVSRYLSMLFLINVTFGISVGLGLFLIGVPNAILWGILAAALRFIPYIGPWIAAAMPIGLSMAISTGWVTPILTAGLFVVLELFSNNVVEPWLYGKNTGVSAVAVLVAAVFWTWLWGPVGLVLATPLTVCVLVLGKHVPQLAFLDILLGTEPVFEPKKRIYQRLLAGDQEEAADLLDEYLENQPLVEVYDTVLIPALVLAETHSQSGDLIEGKRKFIMESLKEMIQDRRDVPPEVASQLPATDASKENGDSSHLEDVAFSSGLRILCLPARSEADEIAALMLAQVLETKGCLVRAVAITSLANEMSELFEHHTADMVYVSATPPAAVMHARYLCKRVRERLPNVPIVVGLWDEKGDLSKPVARIGCGATVVATLAEAVQQLHLSSPPPESEAPSQPEREPAVAAAHP